MISFIFDLLHSFGAGIAFVLGIGTGMLAMQLATISGRKEIAEDLKKQRHEYAEHFGKQIIMLARIAEAIETDKTGSDRHETS